MTACCKGPDLPVASYDPDNCTKTPALRGSFIYSYNKKNYILTV